MIRNKKGFSLVELMVVVAIIGILATLAVPNYIRFQAKAKQANAKSELSGIYGAEKAFYAEYDAYSNDLVQIGYLPDGIPVDANGCPITAPTATIIWPTRYYATGFAGATASDVATGLAALTCVTGAQKTPNFDAKLANVTTLAGFASNLNPGYAVGSGTFTAGALGLISGGLTHAKDEWSIDQNKNLANVANGL